MSAELRTCTDWGTALDHLRTLNGDVSALWLRRSSYSDNWRMTTASRTMMGDVVREYPDALTDTDVRVFLSGASRRPESCVVVASSDDMREMESRFGLKGTPLPIGKSGGEARFNIPVIRSPTSRSLGMLKTSVAVGEVMEAGSTYLLCVEPLDDGTHEMNLRTGDGLLLQAVGKVVDAKSPGRHEALLDATSYGRDADGTPHCIVLFYAEARVVADLNRVVVSFED